MENKPSFLQKNVLGTGLSGFLGSYLHSDNQFKFQNVSLNIRRNKELLLNHFSSTNPDYFIHLAGVPNHALCKELPELGFKVHVMDTLNTLEAIRCYRKIKGYIYI